jgi:hypothetical protein
MRLKVQRLLHLKSIQLLESCSAYLQVLCSQQDAADCQELQHAAWHTLQQQPEDASLL